MIRKLTKLDRLFNNDFRTYSQMLNDLNQGYTYLGYFVDDNLVSFASLLVLTNECEIHYIVTNNNNQKLGYGSELLNYILVTIKVKKFFIEVNINNNAAINLYKKHGFNKLYKRDNYYPDGDALVMQKDGD